MLDVGCELFKTVAPVRDEIGIVEFLRDDDVCETERQRSIRPRPDGHPLRVHEVHRPGAAGIDDDDLRPPPARPGESPEGKGRAIGGRVCPQTRMRSLCR